MKRRDFLINSTLLAASLGLPAGMSVAAEDDGTLRILGGTEPPFILGLAANPYYTAIANDGLLHYDFDLEPQPQLATEWSVSDDGLEYRFKLRQGVKWHDGTDFTADDVAFSLQVLRETHPRQRAALATVETFEVVGPHEVRLLLSKPTPYLIRALSPLDAPIFPKHLFEGSDPLLNPVSSAPVGTGPYIFKEWVRGSHILYVRNPDYWDKGYPQLEQVIVRFISDTNARVAALETGEVFFTQGSNLPLGEVARLGELPFIGLETNGYQYSNGVQQIEFNLDRPYISDINVRRAIAHAIDRDVVLNVAQYGIGEKIYGPISPNFKQFAVPDLPYYAFDTAKANALLDEAGYPRNGSGTRFALELHYVPFGQHLLRGAEYFRQALSEIGIAVTIVSQDYPTFLTRVYTDRAFDFIYNSTGNSYDPTAGVQRLYWSRNFKPGVPFSNGAHYENAEVDRLLEAAATEVDAEKRASLFAQFQRIIAEDVPTIAIVSAPAVTVYNKRLVDHTLYAEDASSSFSRARLTA